MTCATLDREMEEPTVSDEWSTDERMLNHIAEAMEQSSYRSLRWVDLQYEQGTVVLRGRVASYFLKQMAQVTVLSISGVERVENQLQVTNGSSIDGDATMRPR